jgi:hypothetical protein
MLRRFMMTAFLGLAILSQTPAAEDGWVALFNGKDLTGWEQRNGTATYRVEDGVIVGKTSEGSPNSFLCSKKNYSDFELKFEVKVDDALNSGVQIRSQTKDNKPENRVHGPQVEIATNGSAGFVYGESLPKAGGWLAAPTTDQPANKAFKKGEWNSYYVKAKGKTIETKINDIPIVKFDDEKSGMLEGFLGLQVHGIGKKTGPYEVRWKNLYIKELK